MNPNQIAISLENINYSYEQVHALRDVNLTIHPLDSVCIVGPNGGGKTTLIKLIIGLLTPDNGKLLIYGKKPKEMKKMIGYVPQYAQYDTQFPISTLEVVCMGRLGNSLTGRYSDKDRQTALQALAEVDLENQAKHPFSSLSGGQRQRVLIARALASEGKILILDEPTANIDQESESQFFEILSRLNKKMTILMVTHDVGFSSKFFKRIACVNREVAMHPTSELTGQLIKDMYGGDIHMIRHDHCCNAGGHTNA